MADGLPVTAADRDPGPEEAALVAVQAAIATPPVVAVARAMSHFGEHALGWVVLSGLGALVQPKRRRDWLLVGAGAVAASIGLAFGLDARSKWSDAQKHCRGTLCDREGGSLASDAQTSGNLSTAFVIGGLVVAGAGVTLLVVAPRSPSRAALRVTPSGLFVAEGTWQ